MARIKETGKYIYRTAKAELKKRDHLPDLVLIPDKKYKKSEVMKLKFVKYNPKTKTLIFKITKRDHKF
ncbi:hypothetical protein HYX17_02550 [Candidatus Woesearchaeota archaeon]|nr:hypothetical protein [Candidatus Woesearchaeota archaeon]